MFSIKRKKVAQKLILGLVVKLQHVFVCIFLKAIMLMYFDLVKRWKMESFRFKYSVFEDADRLTVYTPFHNIHVAMMTPVFLHNFLKLVGCQFFWNRIYI